ncbi:MAG: flagellar biosynthesis protein FliQ [Thermacetogeniaceae bacterium]
MTEGYVVTLGQNALYTALLIAAPLLGISLIIGLVVGIFQATTQLQDQTLSFVPKIIAVLVAVVLLAPWMMKIMDSFTQNLYLSIQYLTR